MSYTSMYGFDADGDMATIGEYRNAWRSGPMLWDFLLTKYGLVKEGEHASMCWDLLWGGDPNKPTSILDMCYTKDRTEEEQKARDERRDALEARFTDAEWWAYHTTLDRFVISAECAADLVDALREVQMSIERFQAGQDKQAPSFGEQADSIEAEYINAMSLRGFAWNQTSVSNTWPQVPICAFDSDACGCKSAEPEPEPGDDGYCDRVPPSLDRDGGYWRVTGLRECEWVERKHEHARCGG